MSFGRGKGGPDRTPRVKPVERIELPDKFPRRRLIAVVLLVLLAVTAIAFGVRSCLARPTGWQAIEGAGSDLSCRAEFVLQYNIGAAGVDANAEYRALNNLWSEITVTGYRLFSADAIFDGVTNPAALNAHPNEVLTVDDALYAAFTALSEEGNRLPYLGILYAYAESLFGAADDAQAAHYDPYENEALRTFFAKVAAYAQSETDVRLELLGENRVRLAVSDAYLQFARDEGVDRFFDFGWLKNAFLCDYLAGRLSAAGYTDGTVTSLDGFTRTLAAGEFGAHIFRREGNTASRAGSFTYTGPMALVELRAFPVGTQEASRFYITGTGDIRTGYLSLADGLCRAALPSVTLYAGDGRCAVLAMAASRVYIAASFDEGAFLSLCRGRGFDGVYCRDGRVYYTQEGLALSDLACEAVHI